ADDDRRSKQQDQSHDLITILIKDPTDGAWTTGGAWSWGQRTPHSKICSIHGVAVVRRRSSSVRDCRLFRYAGVSDTFPYRTERRVRT
ncbi:hypothetical protein ABVB25_36185, partial [Streptomyces anthocyanicus]|uniref:hypothetical protein n=1 Tax=Streptomyces anthocyanicus TaxID=68174 RepID=UPI003369FE71